MILQMEHKQRRHFEKSDLNHPVAAPGVGMGSIPPVRDSLLAPPPVRKIKWSQISHFRQNFGFLQPPPHHRIFPLDAAPQKKKQ